MVQFLIICMTLGNSPYLKNNHINTNSKLEELTQWQVVNVKYLITFYPKLKVTVIYIKIS